MTDIKQKCDLCESEKYYAGVASCGLGAMSHAWCHVCLSMGASMKVLIENLVESCGGIEGVSDQVGLTYYDKEKDSYIDYRTKEIIPIKMKDGTEFQTKSAFEQWDKENN